ncbi:gamma-glutamyltransferase [Corynebacterium yudongzhengii]|nr:gamma-glutamyltransferase [Corynebacterium yudongzhengii]
MGVGIALVAIIVIATLTVLLYPRSGTGYCGITPGYETHLVSEDPEKFAADTSAHVPADGFMAVTPHPEATRVACEVLRERGSAADAIVAAQYVLGLVEPAASGPGGGALVTYADKSGTVESWDGTVYAPAEDTGERRNGSRVREVGVPRVDALLRDLHAAHGAGASFSELTEPAVHLAREGYTVDTRLAGEIEAHPDLLGSTDSAVRRVFGDDPQVGDTIVNSAYADYVEETARRIDEDEPLQGIDKRAETSLRNQVGAEDQAEVLVDDWRKNQSAAVEPDDALCEDFQDLEVCGSPSPATGMMITAHVLGIVDDLDLARLTPYQVDSPQPVMRATAAHLLSEAERLAFADANAYMGDPAPHPELSRAYREKIVTNPEYHAELADAITQQETLPEPSPRRLPGFPNPSYAEYWEEGTSQVSVRDFRGNTASMTTTLGAKFGSKLMVNGFFLNNSLANFTRGPNQRAAGLHPKTTMSPVVVLRNGEPMAALGSPGGNKIPAYVLKTLLAWNLWGLDPNAAVLMPTVGAVSRNQVLAEPPLKHSEDFDKQVTLLKRWGQDVETQTMDSGVSFVVLDDEGLHGAADPRRHGLARGGEM